MHLHLLVLDFSKRYWDTCLLKLETLEHWRVVRWLLASERFIPTYTQEKSDLHPSPKILSQGYMYEIQTLKFIFIYIERESFDVCSCRCHGFSLATSSIQEALSFGLRCGPALGRHFFDTSVMKT